MHSLGEELNKLSVLHLKRHNRLEVIERDRVSAMKELHCKMTFLIET
jgi:hypothetical protein